MADLYIGCVADDFTGATDMASFLVKGGLNTEICDGIPDQNWRPAASTQALVIALKSRTEPVEIAVKDSLACFQWLYTKLKAKQLYFKYCSTFDSTSEGNIGPVIDAVLTTLALDNVIISPALPVNGRSVYLGHLFVNGLLLENSSMRQHPLTPMTNSNLMNLIEQQGRGKATNISHTTLESTADDIKQQLQSLSQYQYLVVDHFNDQHAKAIVTAFADHPFLSGSSGLAEPLAQAHALNQSLTDTQLTSLDKAPTLVLAGSCSVATREQIAVFSEDYASYQIDPTLLHKGEISCEDIWQWFVAQDNAPCLIYSSQAPETVKEHQQTMGVNVAQLLEQTFASIAKKAVEHGTRRLIVAGGETSGAVTQALCVKHFVVGPSIAPGVPIIQPREFPELLMTLKSGNFGAADFFTKALTMMNE
jgi:uncharacterized protein YgbK (DUF1537 family)